MFGSTVIELILGLVWMYLLLSTVCSAACEYVLSKLKPRSGLLREALSGLFAPKGGGAAAGNTTVEFFLSHGLIRPSPKGKDPPYISGSVFATALIDSLIAGPGNGQPPAIAELRESAEALPDSAAKDAVLAILDTTGDNLAEVTKRIESWFADVMDRLSGVYKRNAQLVLFITGFVLAAAINADTIMIARALMTDQELRATVIAGAIDAASEPEPPEPAQPPSQPLPDETLKNAIAAAKESSLPFGWSSVRGDARSFPWRTPTESTDWADGTIPRLFSKMVGLLMTAAAVSFGAPFWFDLLNRVTNLRTTGPKPERPKPDTV